MLISIIDFGTQDYDKAAGNSDMQWLAGQGITLTNYFAVTHPSEP
jgi:acid phosphatase